MNAVQKLFRFHGGVKPNYNKEASTGLPIAVAPIPAQLVIPLHQSIGGPPRPLVKAGDCVLKGSASAMPTVTFRRQCTPRPPAPWLRSKCA